MTISITDSVVVYTGDGSTTGPYYIKAGSNNIYIENDTDITVTLRDGATVTAQTLNTHYTVTGAGTNAGQIDFVTAPGDGVEIRIERNTPMTQTLSLTQAGAFSPTSIMGAFDKLTRIVQDLARGITGGATGTYGNDPLTKDVSGTEWEGEGLPLKNIADAEDSSDAVTYSQLQDVLVTAGAGDTAGAASSTDGEVVLFSGTTGKALKRSNTLSGLLKLASGVASAAVSGTDYAPATSGSAILKGNGSGGFSAAAAGTDYAAATSGSSVLKGDGAGGTTAAAATDLGAGTHEIWIPAAAMTARTTNGAATGTTELATNDIMLSSLDFDTTTEEGAGFAWAIPKSWNGGTVTFVPYWTAASGSGGVVWGLAAYAFSNDDAMDTAVSGQQTSTDTLITANDLHIGPASSAITIGGTPADGDMVYFEVTREVADGSDTLAVDAKLLGIMLTITTEAITDA